MSAVITPAAIVNPDAIAARAARFAERQARHALIAEAEAAEQATSDAQGTPEATVSDDEAPVPYALTPTAHSALSASSPAEPMDPAADDWRAILAPSLAAAVTPVALHAMAAAVKSATAGSDLPVLEVARVTLTPGAAAIIATDRYRVHRLTVPAESAAHAEGFVTPADLASVVRTLAPARARRGAEGTLATIRVTVDPDALTMTWEGPDARVVTSWDEPFNYPPAERFLTPEDNRAPADVWHVNPKYMGDAMAAAAVVADSHTPVRVSADAPVSTPEAAMIRVAVGAEDSPTGRFDACLMSVRA